jgi:uncharacterized membrane protein YedE/YeeE
MNFLAYSSDTGAGLAGGLGAVSILIFLVAVVYGIMCLLVPIFIYQILRRATDIRDTLRELNRKLNIPKTAEVTPVVPAPVPPRDSDENWTKKMRNLIVVRS